MIRHAVYEFRVPFRFQNTNLSWLLDARKIRPINCRFHKVFRNLAKVLCQTPRSTLVFKLEKSFVRQLRKISSNLPNSNRRVRGSQLLSNVTRTYFIFSLFSQLSYHSRNDFYSPFVQTHNQYLPRTTLSYLHSSQSQNAHDLITTMQGHELLAELMYDITKI